MIDTEALSCQELVELVTEYLEGALDERDLRAFEGHLATATAAPSTSSSCERRFASSARSRRMTLTQDAETALLQAFRDWKRSS